jgi:hypothetical protein
MAASNGDEVAFLVNPPLPIDETTKAGTAKVRRCEGASRLGLGQPDGEALLAFFDSLKPALDLVQAGSL